MSTGSTTFDCHWKRIGSLVCTTNIFFVAAAILLLFGFLKSTKEIFSLQGAWHSPSTLNTMVHGQAFSIITLQSPIHATPTRSKGNPPVRFQKMRWAALWIWTLGIFTSTQVSFLTMINTHISICQTYSDHRIRSIWNHLMFDIFFNLLQAVSINLEEVWHHIFLSRKTSHSFMVHVHILFVVCMYKCASNRV
jgi:hypothetical protein